jgi:hypothetical protein
VKEPLALWKLDGWGLPIDIGPAFEELRTLVDDVIARPHDRAAIDRALFVGRDIAKRFDEYVQQADEDEEVYGDPHLLLASTFIWLTRDSLDRQ